MKELTPTLSYLLFGLVFLLALATGIPIKPDIAEVEEAHVENEEFRYSLPHLFQTEPTSSSNLIHLPCSNIEAENSPRHAKAAAEAQINKGWGNFPWVNFGVPPNKNEPSYPVPVTNARSVGDVVDEHDFQVTAASGNKVDLPAADIGTATAMTSVAHHCGDDHRFGWVDWLRCSKNKYSYFSNAASNVIPINYVRDAEEEQVQAFTWNKIHPLATAAPEVLPRKVSNAVDPMANPTSQVEYKRDSNPSNTVIERWNHQAFSSDLTRGEPIEIETINGKVVWLTGAYIRTDSVREELMIVSL